MQILILLASFLFVAVVADSHIDSKQLQCLVCRSTIEELENVLAKIDPSKSAEVGGFRMDGTGNIVRKKVPLAKSEVHISDVLDNICEKMSDYVRARHKSNGKLTILNLLSPSGGMNPEMSNVDIIQDEDLNKSLKYYCEDIVEEHQEPIIHVFRKGESNVINEICSRASKLCDDELPSDEDIDSHDIDRTEL